MEVKTLDRLADFVADRTPVPSAGQRGSTAACRAMPSSSGVTGKEDRHELLITHNFVIGWFVRHVLDAPVWRWIGLNQANCAITIVQWDSDRPPTLVSFNDTGHL
ncbi:histidine phosphatase family protein [Dactylosporangium sp. CA-139114]|uniref:histidine phosphatase family protein n=1 Tax=Dactylosporangium sp. CA-139114 TaxID=3239931 RepID=UPI003D999BFF